MAKTAQRRREGEEDDGDGDGDTGTPHRRLSSHAQLLRRFQFTHRIFSIFSLPVRGALRVTVGIGMAVRTDTRSLARSHTHNRKKHILKVIHSDDGKEENFV